MAQGQGTTIATGTSSVGTGSGTSYSSPIIAGMTACLWQANPTLKVMEIQAAIKESASRADFPDNYYGWGIPDYMEAHTIMTNVENQIRDNVGISIIIRPNPFKTELNIELSSHVNEYLGAELYNTIGTLIYSEVYYAKSVSSLSLFQNKLENLKNGIYFLKINLDGDLITKKVIKQ